MLAHWYKFSRVRLSLAVLTSIAVLALGAGFAWRSAWPAIGAQGAEVLRALVGEEAVANLETAVFQMQDNVRQWQYRAQGAEPPAPWAPLANGESQAAPAPTAPLVTTPVPTPADSTDRGTAVTSSSSPLTSAAASDWTLAPLPGLGSIPGEGRWAPYLHNGVGQTVAYRTFFQPDAQRPYAVVAIVAFDLQATRLHFVLGSQEPRSSVAIDRPGTIPAADLKAGSLLAAFNGGFKAEHGHFGVVVDGTTLIPPRPGLGTVAIFSNGQVRIGAWGSDINASSQAMVYRQNGPLLIHNGQINAHTADNSPQDWGYTVGGKTATWRSGLGISADGRTLYYVAGPSLTLPALAQSLSEAGAVQAVQLDINDYWVRFDAFQAGKSGLEATPLFDSMKSQADQRYLRGFNRDFFYVTANAG